MTYPPELVAWFLGALFDAPGQRQVPISVPMVLILF